MPNTEDAQQLLQVAPQEHELSNFTIRRKPIPTITESSQVNSKPVPSRKRSKQRTLLLLWWWELSACVIFIAAFVAVIVTLYTYNGRPLPRLPFGISINTLIAIYVVIIRATLATVITTGIGQLVWTWLESDRPLYDVVAFDQASRGVYGSLLLIWRVHVRQILATFGAILGIAALAFDPFIQQLIHYSACPNYIVPTDIFTIPRTNYFIGHGYHDGAESTSIEPGMQSAINAAFFAPLVPVDVSCSTGNCTSGPFSSLGYCSSCEDITDLLRIEYACIDDRNSSIFTLVDSKVVCPGNTSLAISSSTPDNTTSMIAVGGPDLALMAIGTGTYTSYDLEIVMGKTPLSDERIDPFTMNVVEGCDDPATNNTWRCRGYGAAGCHLRPCVRTYIANMTLGTLFEQQIDQTPIDLDWSYSLADGYLVQGVLDLQCVTPNQLQQVIAEGYNISKNQRWLPYNVTFNTTLSYPDDESTPYPQSLLGRKCLYMIFSVFSSSLYGSYLVSFFNGTIIGEWDESSISLLSGPQIIQAMYNYDNIDFDRVNNTINNLSLSITNYIRQNGQVNQSANAIGDVHHYATCVEVQWAWIAYPATIIVGSLLFCILVIITTARHNSEVWKSSPLAMIYHGPFTGNGKAAAMGPMRNNRDTDSDHHFDGDGGDDDDEELRSIDGMEATAHALVVKLDKMEGELRISDDQVRRRRK